MNIDNIKINFDTSDATASLDKLCEKVAANQKLAHAFRVEFEKLSKEVPWYKRVSAPQWATLAALVANAALSRANMYLTMRH